MKSLRELIEEHNGEEKNQKLSVADRIDKSKSLWEQLVKFSRQTKEQKQKRRVDKFLDVFKRDVLTPECGNFLKNWVVKDLLHELDDKFVTADLHTHLLGMGTYQFWIKTMKRLQKERGIELSMEQKLSFIEWYGPRVSITCGDDPEFQKFWKGKLKATKKKVRFQLKNPVLMTSKRVAFTYDLLQFIFDNWDFREKYGVPVSKALADHLKTHEATPEDLVTDIIFDIESLRESLDIENLLGEEEVIHEIANRLGMDKSIFKKQHIIFDARKQEFDFLQGVTCTQLIKHYNDKTNRAARAQIRNCFTMLNIDGSRPSDVDLVQRYQRRFTPEFYPMRFRLRDPIYSQHLQVLESLMKEVLDQYRTKGRTSYVEFSVGANDLLRPWVYRHLVAYKQEKSSSTREILPITYNFLLGINRGMVLLPIDGVLTHVSSEKALKFLHQSPHLAMLHSLSDAAYTAYDSEFNRIKKAFHISQQSDDNAAFHRRVVGLDLFSEEFGFPYCPFVQDKWIQLCKDNNLGVRLHCGEGVLRENEGILQTGMLTHMHIMTTVIRRLKQHGIMCRVGHGVAFRDCILQPLPNTTDKLVDDSFCSHELKIYNPADLIPTFPLALKRVMIEVNLTSNRFLVQQSLPKHKDLFLDGLDNWALSTDDDGVWFPEDCKHGIPDNLHNDWLKLCRRKESNTLTNEEVEKLKNIREGIKKSRKHTLTAREYCTAIEMDLFDDIEALLRRGLVPNSFKFERKNSAALPGSDFKLSQYESCKHPTPRQYAVILLALADNIDDKNQERVMLFVALYSLIASKFDSSPFIR